MIDWTTDPDMRRRAQVGLNKGEAHHALKRAINFHQLGELRDRTEEGQPYRVAGLNLLTAIIIYCNTLKLGAAVSGCSPGCGRTCPIYGTTSSSWPIGSGVSNTAKPSWRGFSKGCARP